MNECVSQLATLATHREVTLVEHGINIQPDQLSLLCREFTSPIRKAFGSITIR